METPSVIDLSELLKMFGIYRRRLNSAEPAQQELYDALIDLDKSVWNKIGQLRDLYWNVLQKQTLTHKHKANKIIKAVGEWRESFPEENLQPTDLYEEFTVELSRSKDLPTWGISIIGGEEDQDGPGIYISEVNDNSIAQSSGALMPFDRIVEVNGNNTRIVKHDVANELLRVRNETLMIKISRKMDIYPKEQESQMDILDVYLQTDNPSKGFGIKIKGGRDDPLIDGHDGIFITHVSGVAAENAQLHKGDRIISANDTNLEHVDREEAFRTITSCPHLLHLKVQKRALLQISQPGVSSCIREVFLRSIGGNYGLSLGGTEGKIYVTRLTSGGAGEKNGHVFLGDQVIAVGDHSTRNCSLDQAIKYLQNYPQQINLKLVHAQREFNSLVNAGLLSDCISHSSTRESMVTESLYFKIHFDYNPLQDKELPELGLELRDGMIVRIDDFGDVVGPQKHRLLQMEYRWFTATLVEDTHERLDGLIPSLNSLQQGQGKYPGVTLPKKRGKSSKRWFPQKKAEVRKTWNKHEFYSQIWKIEKDQTRIILIVGALNKLLVDIFIQECPDTYQTLIPLPPGNFELSSSSPFATACTNIVASKKHVLLAIGPELLSNFLNLNLNPIVIVTYPIGLRTGGDMDQTSSSDGLLDASQLDQAQTTANQIRNEFGIFISGVASGSNLGEIYYQVCVLISENSYKKIDWSDTEPERKPFALSESCDLLDSFNKKSC